MIWFKKTTNPDVGKVPVDRKSLSKARVTPNSATDQSTLRVLPRNSDRYTNVSLAELKYTQSPDALMRALSRWDPDFSAGVWNFKAVCESGFKVIAYNRKGEPDDKNQRTIENVVLRLNLADNYEGFTFRSSLDQLCDRMIDQILVRGACAAEVVLNDIQTLGEIVLIDPVRVEFTPEYLPIMRGPSGNDISLDIPTFMWEVLDPDPDKPYENPPFLSAINAIMFRVAILEDLQTVVKRVAYPRISVKIIEEIMIKNAPAHLKHNPVELEKWLKARLEDIGTQLTALAPDEAAIFFDSIEMSYVANKENPTIDFRPLIEVIDQQIISALKTLPTILGRQFSSSLTQSAVESVLFTKSARRIQSAVEKMLSRILTLSLLMEGRQGFVLFKYKPIELRPESELSQHRTMMADLTLKLLSLGFKTDTEAAEELTGSPTLPPTFKPLSGTGFYDKNLKGAADEATKKSKTDEDPRAKEKTGGGRAPRGQNSLAIVL